MNAPQQVAVSPDVEIKMQDALKAQRESYLQEGFVSAETRIDRLNRAIDVLVRHADRISEAINKDFVCRPDQVNLMTDVAASIGSMKHCRKHLKKWMKDEKRPSTFPVGAARRPLTYSISAQGRGRYRRTLELPGGDGVPAAGWHPRCGQPGHDQALRIHSGDLQGDRGNRRRGL